MKFKEDTDSFRDSFVERAWLTEMEYRPKKHVPPSWRSRYKLLTSYWELLFTVPNDIWGIYTGSKLLNWRADGCFKGHLLNKWIHITWAFYDPSQILKAYGQGRKLVTRANILIDFRMHFKEFCSIDKNQVNCNFFRNFFVQSEPWQLWHWYFVTRLETFFFWVLGWWMRNIAEVQRTWSE